MSDYVEIPLAPGEEVIFEQTAGIHQVGGLLVFTNYRLLFAPYDMRLVGRLLQFGLRAIGGHVAAIVGHSVKATVKYIEAQEMAVPAEGIAEVRAGRSGDRLEVETADGSVFEFIIAASRFTVRGSPRNREVRDELVKLIGDYI